MIRVMKYFLVCTLVLLQGNCQADTELPNEPVEIGSTPQVFVDDYIVDNRWALRKGKEELVRQFHQPKKSTANPVLAGKGGYTNVVWDEKAKLYRMVYQDFWIQRPKPNLKYTYAIAYAESKDGIHWETPDLNLFEWKDSAKNNCCLRGPKGGRASSPFLLDLPEDQKHGYQFIMLYRTVDGLHLIGSDDCIHWDPKSDYCIAHHFHPDTNTSIVMDSKRKEFVCYTRATNRYQDRIPLEGGATRRVARMANRKLWDDWSVMTQNIIIPDAEDAKEGFNYIYGMPARYYAGVYWGFAWPFKLNTDIYTSLMISRNGKVFESLPGRPRLIDLGAEGSWDAGMVFGSPNWIEVGDEWKIYYCGYDGPHGTMSRTPGIGLASIRKEGFVSLHGPKGGGVVTTRSLVWPGGDLSVNCDAQNGELKVRVCDSDRKPLESFGYDESVPFQGDQVSQKITWSEKTIDSLKGKTIRLEFYLTNADLYSFQAVTPE